MTTLINYPFLAPVTVVTAGAGYGKTTLLQEWSSIAFRPVSWICVNAQDNDITTFMQRLQLAFASATSRAGSASANGNQMCHQSPERDELIGQFTSARQEFSLVLDDCHLLTNSACVSLLDDIIHHASPRLFFLLASRKPIPLRLGRIRAQLDLKEIGHEDLKFTQAETAKVLREQFPFPVSREHIHRLQEETEGWITGIRLTIQAANHRTGGGDQEYVDSAIRDAFLDEYVAQEILDPLPDQLRSFVLASSMLPYISNESEILLGLTDTPADVINILERDFGFVSVDQKSDGRARYHQLICQSLQRLSRTRQPNNGGQSWHRQVANWLIAKGDLESAADIALRTADDRLIAEFVTPITQHLALRSRFEELGDWLQRVPESVLSENADLAYWKALSKLGLGQTVGMDHTLDALQPRLHATRDPLHIGRGLVGRGMLAFHTRDHKRTESCLMDALERLPADAYVERLHASTLLGLLSNRLGADDDASIIYTEATSYAAELPLDEQWSWRTLGPDRGNVYALRGALHSATTKYRMLLAELPMPLKVLEGLYRCRLVSLAIEQDDLRTARQELDRISKIKGRTHLDWHHDAVIAEVRYFMAKGQFDEADRLGSEHVKNVRRSPKKDVLVTHLANIWLLRGEYLMVESWLNDLGEHFDPWIDVFGDVNPVLLKIDLALARGRLEFAAGTAASYATAAAKHRRWSEFIAFSARHAAAIALIGDSEKSREVIMPAIERGLRGGFARSFLTPVVDTKSLHIDLWHDAEQRHRDTDQPESLLPQSLTLSGRELEVLHLVAEDKSNQQIADELFISANTVRNHLVNITRRLDVSSRHAAVQRARQAGLLTNDPPQR